MRAIDNETLAPSRKDPPTFRNPQGKQTVFIRVAGSNAVGKQSRG
jgi:hypothetical protein